MCSSSMTFLAIFISGNSPQKSFFPTLLSTVFKSGKVAFWFLLLFSGIQTFSLAQRSEKESYCISQRIGLEIDSIESEYFNIFPELDGVKSAVYRQDNFGNVRLLVSLASGNDTTIMFSKLAAQQLGVYIDKHEVLLDSSYLVDWGLLPGYNLNRINYFEDHGTLVFVKTDSTVLAGKLLLVTDSTVLLWSNKQPFRPETWELYTKVIRVSDIVQIERKQDLTGRIFGITLGAGLGAAILNAGFAVFGTENLSPENTLYLVIGGGLIGAGIGYLYDISTVSRRKYQIQKSTELFLKQKQKLEKRAVFTKVYPPELRNLSGSLSK